MDFLASFLSPPVNYYALALMARKLKNLDVKFISLVDRPANKKAIIYKSDEEDRARFELELGNLRKDDKQGLVFGTVYEPGVIDSQGDFTDEAEIVKACHNFAKAKRMNMVDFQHNYEPGAGTVVESFIKKGHHPDFPNVKDGAWCVAIQVSEEMKAHMDKIGGLSLAGDADTFEAPLNKSEGSDELPAARVGMNKSRVIRSRVIH